VPRSFSVVRSTEGDRSHLLTPPGLIPFRQMYVVRFPIFPDQQSSGVFFLATTSRPGMGAFGPLCSCLRLLSFPAPFLGLSAFQTLEFQLVSFRSMRSDFGQGSRSFSALLSALSRCFFRRLTSYFLLFHALCWFAPTCRVSFFLPRVK